MGNSLIIRKRRSVKVMKLNGETTKYRTPVKVEEVLKGYSVGHVVLDAEAVKSLGIRAKPLDPWQELKPKKLYFLVELPPEILGKEEKQPETRRVRSVIHMSAKDRLETLMLSKRSASDMTLMRHKEVMPPPPAAAEGGTGMRVKMWLPKAEVEKLMMESKNEAEAAEKIVGLYVANKKVSGSCDVAMPEKVVDCRNSRHVRWKD